MTVNPEAAEWLEALTLEERSQLFHPPVGLMGSLYQLKADHEFVNYSGDCTICMVARKYGELMVIG